MAQQKLDQAMAGARLVALGRFAGAHEIPQGFMGRIRDAGARQVTGATTSRQPFGVAAIRLYPGRRPWWESRRRDYVTPHPAPSMANRGHSPLGPPHSTLPARRPVPACAPPAGGPPPGDLESLRAHARARRRHGAHGRRHAPRSVRRDGPAAVLHLHRRVRAERRAAHVGSRVGDPPLARARAGRLDRGVRAVADRVRGDAVLPPGRHPLGASVQVGSGHLPGLSCIALAGVLFVSCIPEAKGRTRRRSAPVWRQG